MTPEAGGHWFEAVADHLGEAYLRYSFTKGTVNEVDTIIELTGLSPGASVLDVGCGPGRHALELADRGYDVVGVDISETFIGIAAAEADRRGLTNARFEVADGRSLRFDARFDAVISLCQGAFGLSGGPGSETSIDRELDEPILAGMASAAVAGGSVIVSAFSAYFQVKYEEQTDNFDADLGINREDTVVRNPAGEDREVELWTTCYTPRELRLLARSAGLEPRAVYGVSPGRYQPDPPSTDCPEFLLVATVPDGD